MAHADIRSDCEVCYSFRQTLASRSSSFSMKLGTFAEAMASECSVHLSLLKAILESVPSAPNPHSGIDIASIYASKDVRIISPKKGNAPSVKLAVELKDFTIVLDFVLMQEDSVPNHPGIGRRLDPKWVDLDILKKWKLECLRVHGPRCENPMKIQPARPAWLIDVESQCLVPGIAGDNFVALSYTWGDALGLRTHFADRVKFQEPGILRSPEIAENLAPTIQHVIQLTSLIGERYLWVDALCISHADREATKQQLNLMGAIYASAVVTIVTIDTNSKDGILGLRGISAPRKKKQQIVPFGEAKLLIRSTSQFALQTAAPYHERGWTYQEYQMSQRRMLFCRGELHWQCQCSAWHEELIFGAEPEIYRNPRPSTIFYGFPDLDTFISSRHRYNKRNLSYEEDALPGISGLLSIYSRAFPGGFIYGLPQMFFDKALGWRPNWGNNLDLKRRISSGRSSITQPLTSALPSWSWIGWQGWIDQISTEPIRFHHGEHRIEETIPITEWYTSESARDPPSRRRRITSSWFENRDRFKDLSRPLPDGWSRHEAPEQSDDYQPHLYSEGCGKYVYKHCNMPDEIDCSWYYPFPVADIQESTPFYSPEQTPYLFCNTKKAHLWAHQVTSRDEGGQILHLRNKTCSKIGLLRPHNDQQRQTFPK